MAVFSLKSIYDALSSGPLVQGELTYTYYTNSSAVPTTEAGLDDSFTTVTTGVNFGGTGIHTGSVNFGSSGQIGGGGAVGTKPSYLPANNYAWMVEGRIFAPETGTYTFGVDGDDAVDVHVNGIRVANAYGSHGFAGVWSGSASVPTQSTGTITLEAGKDYSFRARIHEGSVDDGIQVGWRKPSDGSISLIPSTFFYRST